MKHPKPPEDWEDPKPKSNKREPEFIDIDNLGLWSSYCYKPTFKKATPKKGTYVKHCLPTGCKPFKKIKDGKRMDGGWEFHYRGWMVDPNEQGEWVFSNRSGANQTNLFPESRKGQLDCEVLKKLGMKKKVMDEKDCLFFISLSCLSVTRVYQVWMMILVKHFIVRWSGFRICMQLRLVRRKLWT